jgi:hypothetical protein
MRLATRAAALAVATTLALWAPALADDLGGSGGAPPTGTLTQLTQTVQQLAQQVRQVVQVVGQVTNFASGIFSGIAGTLFGGAGGVLGGLGGALGGLGGIFGGGGPGAVIGAALHLPSRLPVSSWLDEITRMVTAALFQTGNSVWSEFGTEWGQAPDYAYSTGTIADQIQALAGQFSGQVSDWLSQLAARLRSAPQPQPYTPEWSASYRAANDPAFAARAHGVEQAQVAATASQAQAMDSAQRLRDIANSATSDTTPQDAAQAAAQIAQETAAAVQAAPSTRAAVEVMAASLTQQQAQALAAQAAIASRLDALITQQAEIGLELADAVAGLGTVTGLLSQSLTQALQDQAQSDINFSNAAAGSVSGLVGELTFIGQGGDSQGLEQFLTRGITAP